MSDSDARAVLSRIAVDDDECDSSFDEVVMGAFLPMTPPAANAQLRRPDRERDGGIARTPVKGFAARSTQTSTTAPSAHWAWRSATPTAVCAACTGG